LFEQVDKAGKWQGINDEKQLGKANNTQKKQETGRDQSGKTQTVVGSVAERVKAPFLW